MNENKVSFRTRRIMNYRWYSIRIERINYFNCNISEVIDCVDQNHIQIGFSILTGLLVIVTIEYEFTRI